MTRGQGQLRVCHDMFKKNLSKILDDPARFSSSYISFLTEEGTIRELNTGYRSVREVSRKQVRVFFADFSYNHRPTVKYLNLGSHSCRNG